VGSREGATRQWLAEDKLCWTHKKTLERDALLKRHREIQAELAQIERNIREIEARLPVEEQLRLKLRRWIATELSSLLKEPLK
jgi:hypothetical protein